MQEPEIDLGTPEVEPIEESPVKQAPKSLAQMLSAITDMVHGGQITSTQARRFRADLGIAQSSFTKKRPTDAERKSKRKAARAARKRNRA